MKEENQHEEFRACVAKAKMSLIMAYYNSDRIDEAMQMVQEFSKYLTELSRTEPWTHDALKLWKSKFDMIKTKYLQKKKAENR